jgi:hypothetical protein
MQFNQHNHNAGDVNNAISGKGNVVQTVGTANTVKVSGVKKEGLLALLWKKVKGAWKWIAGLFGAA